MRTMHLFAGAGGGLLADLILGHTPVVAVEWDRVRCGMLEDKANRGWFPGLEVVCADVHTVDGGRWGGRVDCVHAGIPCPRWSSARRGAGNPPDLWDEVYRITSDARPRFLFLESVPGIRRELGRFQADMRRIGYSLRGAIINDAASLGAPHARRRFWCLFDSDENGEPVRPVDAEAPRVPDVVGRDWWEADPRGLRMDDGVASRMDRLEAAGDGQVPLQAAAAWLILTGTYYESITKRLQLTDSKLMDSTDHAR